MQLMAIFDAMNIYIYIYRVQLPPSPYIFLSFKRHVLENQLNSRIFLIIAWVWTSVLNWQFYQRRPKNSCDFRFPKNCCQRVSNKNPNSWNCSNSSGESLVIKNDIPPKLFSPKVTPYDIIQTHVTTASLCLTMSFPFSVVFSIKDS